MPSPCNKSPTFVVLTYQLPLILSTTPSYSIVFPHGLAFPLFHTMVLFISLIPHIYCRVPPHSSPSSPLTCRVPQGSVPGPILFNLYTTPLSSLISTSSISHLLYADDTQLFISFVPKNVSFAMNNLNPLSLPSRLGCLLTILLSIPLKLNSFLSVSLSKPVK